MKILVEAAAGFPEVYPEVTHDEVDHRAAGAATEAVPASLIFGIDLQTGVTISLVEGALYKAAPV